MHGNIFGLEAMKTAYETGEEWLESLLSYLEGNFEFLDRFFKEKIPAVKVMRPEGTCLAWLDFRALNLSAAALNRMLIHEAKIGLSAGELFGPGGEGFQRFNFACPRARLEEGLERLLFALDKHTSK